MLSAIGEVSGKQRLPDLPPLDATRGNVTILAPPLDGTRPGPNIGTGTESGGRSNAGRAYIFLGVVTSVEEWDLYR